MLAKSKTIDGETPQDFGLHCLLFLTALCTLLLQILLTRVLSVVMWYHLTFAVISISLLGIAAGAIHFYRKYPDAGSGDGSIPDFSSTTSLGLNLFSGAVALPIILMSVLVATPTMSIQGFALLAVYFCACGAPFYASGYVTAAIFRAGSKRISSLYALDLIGASLGCLLAIPLLDHLGGIGSLAMVGLLAAVGSAVLAVRAGLRSRGAMAVVTALAFSGLVGRQLTSTGLDVRTVKLSAREVDRPVLESKWNSHSRLAVLDYFDPEESSPYPFLSWGLSDAYEGWLPRQYLFTIDGASETPLTELKEEISEHAYLSWDVSSMPYHLRRGAKTLVIGAGGGRDIMTSLWFGSKDVTGVELNQGIVDWVRGDYAEFAGYLYDRPEVTIHVDDGRSFVRSSSERYEVIQISMIDTFAATAAGAYTLSENNLYTSEAFDEYLEHLTADGILSINRFFITPPQQTLRIVTMAREALMRRGVSDPTAHIVVVKKNDVGGDNGLVMIKPSPFTPAETAKVKEVCSSRQFELVCLPGADLENVFTAYLGEADPNTFYAAYPFDVRPPTDDWPFFFNTCKVATIWDALSLRESMSEVRVYNFDAVFILFVLLALAVVSLGLFIFIPLRRSRGDGSGGGAGLEGSKLVYFVCLGAGFILMEVVLIQRFQLYLGHPIYSLSVILVSVLAFSGIGSAITTRFSDAKLSRHLVVTCAGVLACLLIHEACWVTFLNSTLGAPRGLRIVLAVLSLLPVGICIGMPYPLGLRAISAMNPAGLPWVWAVNASASVVGSIAAFAIAMAAGSRVVLVLSGLCYVGAIFSSRALRFAKEAEVSKVSFDVCLGPVAEESDSMTGASTDSVLTGHSDTKDGF